MTKHNRASGGNQGLLLLIILLAVLLVALLAVAVSMGREDGTGTEPSGSAEMTQPSSIPATEPPETTEEPTTVPTEPPVTRTHTATVAATGDMLMHMPVVNSFYKDGSYQFDGIFSAFRDYVQMADYAVANLETTLCGTDNGYKYGGFPAFNTPDTLVDSLKNAGFDLLLTANNHSYDTKLVGMKRTLEVIEDRKLDYLGTYPAPDAPKFTVKQINGISIGMACYTYNMGTKADGSICLNNGNAPLPLEASRLINSFDYAKLDVFYREIEENISQMKAQGAEATVLFIHWGDEYQLTQNSKQSAIAQKLCDLGVDVIIGGHPHVVQPVELLTGTADPAHKTVCLYSMGNAVSNQRKGYLSSIRTAHTEDGVLFSVTFAKYSDGTVILESAELLPTWVSGKYTILPLDKSVENWQTRFGVSDGEAAKMEESYNRTMEIVGEGMAQVKDYLTTHVAQVEAQLKVVK